MSIVLLPPYVFQRTETPALDDAQAATNGATKTTLSVGISEKASKSLTGQLPARGIKMPMAVARDKPQRDRESYCMTKAREPNIARAAVVGRTATAPLSYMNTVAASTDSPDDGKQEIDE